MPRIASSPSSRKSPKKPSRKRIMPSPRSASRRSPPKHGKNKRIKLSPSHTPSSTPRHGTNPFYELADDLQALVSDLREYGEMSDDICERWRAHPLDQLYEPEKILASLPYRSKLKAIHERLYGEKLNFSKVFGGGQNCT